MKKIILLTLFIITVLAYGCTESANGDMCTFQEESLSADEAKAIAQEYCKEGTISDNFVCNEGTGTWWIEFYPNEEIEGCNPACVVDIKTRTAEINWRCTGLIENPQINLKESCESANGNWIEEFKECEYISEQDCVSLRGNFDECASACRNDPKAEICTLQCVQVCSFE